MLFTFTLGYLRSKGLNRDEWDSGMFGMLYYNFSHSLPDMLQGISQTSPTFHWRDREKPGEVWEKFWMSLAEGLNWDSWDL
ncbi:MAG: hypothetical protein ACJ751_04445 [Niastella sp.]|uniref:hypothetical protein n=1 Tax=Niastella sp. TaxID=1869183 RepID=UPI00389A289F